jgi:hypothetical protein
MTPAAYHRLVDEGEPSQDFYRQTRRSFFDDTARGRHLRRFLYRRQKSERIADIREFSDGRCRRHVRYFVVRNRLDQMEKGRSVGNLGLAPFPGESRGGFRQGLV